MLASFHFFHLVMINLCLATSSSCDDMRTNSLLRPLCPPFLPRNVLNGYKLWLFFIYPFHPSIAWKPPFAIYSIKFLLPHHYVNLANITPIGVILGVHLRWLYVLSYSKSINLSVPGL